MPRAIVSLGLVFSLLYVVAAQAQTGSAERGAQDFRACASCHSLKPDQNMTGPSLAGIWNRTAGTLASFVRYSPALRASGVKWDAKTLDEWLTKPAVFIPGNFMTFPGIHDAYARADLIAFLREASVGRMSATTTVASGQAGPFATNLKTVGPERQVRAIRYCRDSYFVTTADGKTRAFWEPNLRFKTDSSEYGPSKGTPAIMPAGMQGDRASVFFAGPDEISGFIRQHC